MSNNSPIIPGNITYNDLKYRLQNIQCCLPNKATELLNRINLGINCCNEERELNIATAYLDILKCYITDWAAPYSYSNAEDVDSYPSITFYIILPGGTTSTDEIFTYFSINNTGYEQEYRLGSLTDIINDYITNTGLNMVLFYQSVNISESVFGITLDLPCEYSGESITGTFTYTDGKTETTITYGGTATQCVQNTVNIVGPEYTYQDSANCLTREEVVNMFEWLQKYCCMCFPNYGNYDNITIIE